MKKSLFLLSFLTIIGVLGTTAQPTDKPLHNFYVDQVDIAVKYQQIMNAGTTPAKTLDKKLKGTLLRSDNIEKLELDTANDILTGHLKNIVPKYYQNSHSKEIQADFTIEVKDGKYRVFIHDMYLQNNSTPTMGWYGTATNSKERFEELTINKKGTEWKSFAYDVFPDLDDIFTKKFTISSSSDNW